MNALQLNQSIRAKLNEYNNRIRDMNRLHERLNREYPRQYNKLSGCLELVKEYCESSGAVAVEDAGSAALAVDEVEDAGAAAARVGTVSEKIVECLTQFETELRAAMKDDFTEKLKKLIIESGEIKKIENLILSHILPCVTTGEGLVSKEQAFKMLHGKKNFTILGQNYKRSSLLKKCSLRLVRQGVLKGLSESCKLFLSISFLWNGNPLELPDIVADARAASAAASKQPPPIHKVFIKTKSSSVPILTRQTRLVTIDKDGFQWFDKDSGVRKGLIPLDQIVGALDGGTWNNLFGVDISHPGVQGQGDNTYLWCTTAEERDDVIATVNALVELKKLKNGGNKNRKNIIKYRKRRHQNKKKTHKKNANKKSTKKNIRKSKTKKNN